ncbi:MAG: hemolysin family protein [Kiritimatiellales bacterium]|nr:hemolysin family protein [Kiritimatiellales bacterium]
MKILLDHILALALMFGLLLCSAFFSATETALFSLTREQIKRMRAHGENVARMLAVLAGDPSGLLVSILFGNLVVNILFFCSSAVIAGELGHAYGHWIEAAAGFVTLLTVILFGEIFPKALGLSFAEKVVRLNSILLRLWFYAALPIRGGFGFFSRRMERPPAAEDERMITADELRMLIDATRHDSTFGHQEKAIVEDIVNLPEVRVREFMVPRVDLFSCAADTPVAEALREAAEQEAELIPVFEGAEDNITGVVEVHRLFAAADQFETLRCFLGPVEYVPETMRADALLRRFITENLRLVCVVDEYGGLEGAVRFEDLFEELVGEFDAMESPPIEQLGKTAYRMQGQLSIREWRSLFVGFLPDQVVGKLALDTLSGLVISLLKRMPVAGDVVQVHNLRFTVEKVRARRIESVRLDLTDMEPMEGLR